MRPLSSNPSRADGPTCRARRASGAERPAIRVSYQDNIPVLVARDRKGATFDAVLPQDDGASIAAALTGVVTPGKPPRRRRRQAAGRLRAQGQNSLSRRAFAGKTDPRGAASAHQQRQRLPQPPQAMAPPLQRRRHQEPAQLPRLATRPRSLGPTRRSAKMDPRRHRKRTIPTDNAIRAANVLAFFSDCVSPSATRSPFFQANRSCTLKAGASPLAALGRTAIRFSTDKPLISRSMSKRASMRLTAQRDRRHGWCLCLAPGSGRSCRTSR